MAKQKNEEEVKVAIGKWLHRHGFYVYDEAESSRRPRWDGTFQVENVNRKRKPDLVIGCQIPKANELTGFRNIHYVALEIKRGYQHIELVHGFDEVLQYFIDYCWGARYAVKGEGRIPISVIALATGFSRRGYLYRGESKFGRRFVEDVVMKVYPVTFTLTRLLWSQKLNILNRLRETATIPGFEKRVEKGLNLKEIPEVGVLIGVGKHDVLLMTSAMPFYWRVIGLG